MTAENKTLPIQKNEIPTEAYLKKIEVEYVAPYEAHPPTIEELDIQHDHGGLSQYLHDIAPYLPKVPNTREKDREQAEAGDRDGLFYSVLLMIVWQAKKWRNEKTPIMDSIQAANEQVLKFAIPSYKPDISKFSTWAMWWIRRGLRNERISNARPYHISHGDAVDVGKFQRISHDFLEKTGRKPTTEELAASTGFKPKRQRFLERLAGSKSISLSSTEIDADGREIAEKIGDERAIYGEKLENTIEAKMFLENLNKEIAKMDNKLNAQVLKLRLGVNEKGEWTEDPLTLKKVGEMIGVSRERARQRQRKAIDSIDNYYVRSKLLNYLLSKTKNRE